MALDDSENVPVMLENTLPLDPSDGAQKTGAASLDHRLLGGRPASFVGTDEPRELVKDAFCRRNVTVERDDVHQRFGNQ